MLKLGSDSFTTGRSKFFDHSVGAAEPTAKIFIKVRLDDVDETLMAQLDTGAAWSVLDPDTAEALGISGRSAEPAILRTHAGNFQGHLVQVPVTLLADEGESLEVQGTFFISPDSPPGRIFLGYTGLLDSIRIALDSPANLFYFGESDGRP